MATWDRQSRRAQARSRDAALREQLRDVIAPFSPYWRERLAALGRTPQSIDSLAELASVPAVGERDICPDGDPVGAAGLVLVPDESGYTLHAQGPRMRKALARRLFAREAYQRQLEADTRATSYVMGGLGLRFPLASTRSDLDVVARAGARLWQVLGLSGADVVVSALPPAATAEHQALSYAALATATPAFYPGRDAAEVSAVLRLAPATVLVADVADAAELVVELGRRDAALDDLHTLLLVGAPRPAERAAVDAACHVAGIGKAVALAVHAPAGARLLWGQCRESAGASTGYHTYPDLDIVQLVDPETGEPTTEYGEVVLTQLGLRGSALLRWRSADIVDAPISSDPCPACGRTVPRVDANLRRGALVPRLRLGSAPPRGIDLREIAGALVGRPDVVDWRLLAGQRQRGGDQLLLYLDTDGDPAQVAVKIARDLRAAAGLLPTQIVLSEPETLPVFADALTPRIGVRRR